AAGCAPQPRISDTPLPQLQLVETLETDADRLLDYYAYMVELKGDSLLREYRFVEKAHRTDPNDFNRMQLIMLLSSPSASFRNADLAHAMLRDWLKNDYHRYSKLRPLALLYNNYLSETKHREQVLDHATRQLLQVREQNALQSEQLQAQKAHSKELQEKLDALLEMERKLIERNELEQPDTP
ncbi:MAG: hypothetical protein GTO41_06465, partial [Burkholderiales bacterium]|nr:hypothetical protein [Burkholderiales bacterium]